MKKIEKNRNVAIIGIGQTTLSSHKEDQNQVEMVAEAVRNALDDAKMTLDDIDCIVHGNMELFEMQFQPDMWHALGCGSYGKEEYRITTGGTVGATLVCASDNLVASGLYDTVLCVGFEKLQEGNTTGGITNMSDPLWFRNLQTGALTATAATELIREFGKERVLRAAMKYRIMMDKHAMLNPRAHRRLGLEYEQMQNLMETSPKLVGELRLIHMCSQSDGACAMILTSEERVKKGTAKRPVWIRDHETSHREENMSNLYGARRPKYTHRDCAEKLFKRNGITNPLEYFDVFEMYDPSAFWGLAWIRDFLLLEGDEHLKLMEAGEFDMDGKLPINPSGGVISSNPIGATAMLRPAEAALQIRGDAGGHQIRGEVRHALASGFGGTLWTVMIMLEKELNWQEEKHG